MKNLVLIFCFSFFGIPVIYSQHYVGVKGGPNLASINSDQKNSTWLWHAGIFAQFSIGNNFFIQPEMLYNLKGSDQDKLVIDPFKLRFKFEYFSMPFMFGYKLGDHVSIMAGPEMSKLVRATTYLFEGQTNEKFGMKEVDFAINGGVSINFTDQFGIDLRYSHGLVKAVDIEFTDVNGQSLGGTGDRKNRVLQASLFYGFGFGTRDMVKE